jgi:hypothetical protein
LPPFFAEPTANVLHVAPWLEASTLTTDTEFSPAGGYVNTLRCALKIELHMEVLATCQYVKAASESILWTEFSYAQQKMSQCSVLSPGNLK